MEAGIQGRSRARRGRLEAEGRGCPGLASNKPESGCRAVGQLLWLGAGPECSQYTREKVGQNGGDPDRVNISGEGSCLAPSSLPRASHLPECSLGSCPPHPHLTPLRQGRFVATLLGLSSSTEPGQTAHLEPSQHLKY